MRRKQEEGESLEWSQRGKGRRYQTRNSHKTHPEFVDFKRDSPTCLFLCLLAPDFLLSLPLLALCSEISSRSLALGAKPPNPVVSFVGGWMDMWLGEGGRKEGRDVWMDECVHGQISEQANGYLIVGWMGAWMD